MVYIALAVLGLVVAGAALWARRRGQVARRLDEQREARLEFPGRRQEYVDLFLEAATASGKPRGLRWKGCELGPQLAFATDRVTHELYALAGATISFEAIPGGDMEEVEAVGNLRFATVFFIYRDGRWQSDGQSVFNLEPEQAAERYQESLRLVAEEEA